MQQEVASQEELLEYEETEHGFVQYKAAAEAAALTMEPPPVLAFPHHPIKDFDVPPYEQLVAIVDELSGMVATCSPEANRAVYLHCWGGRGRAGTIAACLLCKWCEKNTPCFLKKNGTYQAMMPAV